jgi:hypothetical protein
MTGKVGDMMMKEVVDPIQNMMVKNSLDGKWSIPFKI